jgi:hypothetical protein
MDTAIVVAVVAASVTAIGWLVDHRLSGRRELRRIAVENALRHVESQLKDLYGPLVFYLHEGEQAFQDILEEIGRDGVIFIDGGLETEDDVKTWI